MLLIIVAVVIALVLFSMLRALAFPAILLFGAVYLWISVVGPKTEHPVADPVHQVDHR
jgi:hypothetical protein